jgi:hypothetical protein
MASALSGCMKLALRAGGAIGKVGLSVGGAVLGRVGRDMYFIITIIIIGKHTTPLAAPPIRIGLGLAIFLSHPS